MVNASQLSDATVLETLMFELPTNKQENETREKRTQAKKYERQETELQELARKLDLYFASIGV